MQSSYAKKQFVCVSFFLLIKEMKMNNLKFFERWFAYFNINQQFQSDKRLIDIAQIQTNLI